MPARGAIPSRDRRPPRTAASKAVRGQPDDDHEKCDKDMQDLLKRVRREQAEGNFEAAFRDLNRIELVVGRWRQALAIRPWNNDRSPPAGSALPKNQSGPLGAIRSRAPAENRLANLERKLDQLIRAFEDDRRDRVGGRNPGQRLAGPSPAGLQGQVTKVDRRSGRVEISLGSDDGLVVGHELNVYRNPPPGSQGRAVNLGRDANPEPESRPGRRQDDRWGRGRNVREKRRGFDWSPGGMIGPSLAAPARSALPARPSRAVRTASRPPAPPERAGIAPWF